MLNKLGSAFYGKEIGVARETPFAVAALSYHCQCIHCGSSNLALGGEAENGDDLLAIHDADVATAFAIEALGLVGHYSFIDRMANPKKQGDAQEDRKASGFREENREESVEESSKESTEEDNEESVGQETREEGFAQVSARME